MIDLVETAYEFQHLTARANLSVAEHARVLGLEQLLRGEYLGKRRATEMLRDNPIPTRFTVKGGFANGNVRSISSGGMALITDRPARIGAYTLLRMVNPDDGLEYTFPCRVVWACGRVMGVVFDGLPKKSSVHVSYTLFGKPQTTAEA